MSLSRKGEGELLPVHQIHQHVRITVCLPKHGATADWVKYLVTHELRHFRRHVNIRNAGFGGLLSFRPGWKDWSRYFPVCSAWLRGGRARCAFDDGVVYAFQEPVGLSTLCF